MFNPGSTYRIQFNKDFTFRDLDAALPYLIKLRIGTIYASPIFAATKGSNHGYDGIDPNRINPEIGTEEELLAIHEKLKEAGIGWIQDIVPNHMAYHADNTWLYDYLEKGSRSQYRTFFDNSELSDLYKGPMMAPFLGDQLEKVVAKDELKLVLSSSAIELQYYERRFPLMPESYAAIINHTGNSGQSENVVKRIKQICAENDDTDFRQNWDSFKNDLLQHSGAEWDRAIADFAKDKQALEDLVREQHYELCHWETSNHRINYRRFFTINDLICLNIHRDEVFAPFHRLIGKLCQSGVFNGLRIDHIDGLYNPEKYLNDLRALVGNDKYIIVEKILEPNESLPHRWPIQGNTGYDFLALVNNLFTNTDGKARFTRFYRKFIDEKTSVQDEILENKLFILEHRMAGESENLFYMFRKLDLLEGKKLPASEEKKLKKAIDFFLVHCPVYRFYGNQFPLRKEESEAVEQVLDDVELYEPQLASAVNLLKEVLLEKPLFASEDYRKRVGRFYKRCMQFSGPLMAKGVEDTSMYTYNRFAGHNEVGDSPRNFGIRVAEFHEAMKKRQQHWPLSLNATSTHDTKRGEDVRTRLNVLTDLDKEWIKKSLEWHEINANLKSKNAPDPNDEYLIYQTIIGAHPFPGEDDDDFEERIRTYLQKALREAKTHTNWSAPDEKYEQSAGDFAVKLLDGNNPFWTSFAEFHQKILDFGIINSLSQLLLKFTCPGVPDIYQGTELWNLSLVDPDNRRIVEYILRGEWQEKLEAFQNRNSEEVWEELWQYRYNGAIKMHLMQTLAIQRKRHADVFERGSYQPLEVRGKYSEHVCAFARQFRHYWYVTVIPLNAAQLCKEQHCDIHSFDWDDTRLILPDELSPLARNVLLDSAAELEGEVKVQQLFSILPLALIKFRTENERSSGILMHITSLPSAFGVGDLGPEAVRFADFLHVTRQRQWQILPLNPTVAEANYSPYSSVSSRAGNTMLISPEVLVKNGLLEESDIEKHRLQPSSTADFSAAEKIRKELLQKAWDRFQRKNYPKLREKFSLFCEAEANWLDDYVLFVILQQKQSDKPWWEWPEPLKDRHFKALKEVQKKEKQAIEKLKWDQFIFFDQWKKLRKYCRKKGIALMGDIPIYVSHNSADVWANPYIFKLYPNGRMKGIAGVPPDYFSETGQLWGMPVFDWEVLKKIDYQWWIDRLRVNMKLFDLVRIDHFRAFNDYWEVPAGEETAINGKWRKGPGIHFFEKVREMLGQVPFVAEDLGEISADVFQLRDDLELPGMKVLQFAFGDDMAQSEYIPHNFTKQFVVYTGTHDNNTVRGWYADEGYQFAAQMERYFGRKISEEDIAHAFCQLAHSSVAKMSIIPLQDLLQLDGSARMNNPGESENNWRWRMLPDQILPAHRKLLKQWTVDYNRD